MPQQLFLEQEQHLHKAGSTSNWFVNLTAHPGRIKQEKKDIAPIGDPRGVRHWEFLSFCHNVVSAVKTDCSVSFALCHPVDLASRGQNRRVTNLLRLLIWLFGYRLNPGLSRIGSQPQLM